MNSSESTMFGSSSATRIEAGMGITLLTQSPHGEAARRLRADASTAPTRLDHRCDCSYNVPTVGAPNPPARSLTSWIRQTAVATFPGAGRAYAKYHSFESRVFTLDPLCLDDDPSRRPHRLAWGPLLISVARACKG